ERTARLSVDPVPRAKRLLRAAELAFELGRRDDLTRLLREAEALQLDPLERLRITWIRESFDDGIPADDAAVHSLVEMADRARVERDTGLSLEILMATAVKCWWAAPGETAREAVIAAAERTSVPDDDPRLLNILALTDPVGRAAVVIERLSRYRAGAMPSARTTNLLCGAACAVVDYEPASRFLATAVTGLRAEGRLGPLAQALVMRAWTATWTTKLSLARLDAEEGARLARETAQPQWVAYAQAVEAMLSGLRGDAEAAEALAADAERAVLPTRTSAVLATVQMARGLTALGGGRYADAYQHLRRIFDPTDLAYHPLVRCVAVGDLVEAAVHSGHRNEAAELVRALEPEAALHPAPRVQMPLRHARALLADDARAEALFRAALDSDMTSWPLDRARLQLAYGTWLRRRRHIAESRPHLRAARDTFDALGVLPWGERARQELRASGESSRRRTPDVLDLLTPQEIQIAEMAASGLSNREIGRRLYLSHRTVSTHLYRIFPKLGITSRAELRAALKAGIPAPA
ncbi:MAG: helix-turn-helix transcriptional regulator, partial [Dehalococcoidia bacterium]